jgi:hypothetical protein
MADLYLAKIILALYIDEMLVVNLQTSAVAMQYWPTIPDNTRPVYRPTIYYRAKLAQ